MLHDLKRGFTIHLKAKNHYSKVYTEAALNSRSDANNEFYDRLKSHVKPVDLNLAQWSARTSVKFEQKWLKYANKYLEQAKKEIKAEPEKQIKTDVALNRKWHIFGSDQSHGLIPIESENSLDRYNNELNLAQGTYRAIYQTDCPDASFWGRWTVTVAKAEQLWRQASEELTREGFESAALGLVYETPQQQFSLVLDAAQSDNTILRIGRRFKEILGCEEEIFYDVNGEALLIV